MSENKIDFWFTMGSTYSYLTVRPFGRGCVFDRSLIPLASLPFANPAERNEPRSIRRQAGEVGVHVARY